MKSAAISVAVEAVGSVRQKAKLHMAAGGGGGGGGGGGKATAFQFWRWVALLMILGCTLAVAMWGLLAGFGDLIRLQQSTFLLEGTQVIENNQVDRDQCMGRRIYLYEMPPQFNEQVLKDLCLEKFDYLHMCESFINHGFGLRMEHVMEPVQAWYRTEQFAVEVILHERIKKYKCLTNNPDIADLFYLPYYVGLDVSQYIFAREIQLRDLLTERFFGWLLAQPTWIHTQGHKHVLALSRIIWDFTRQVESVSWGNTILSSYEMQNATKLLIERDPNGADNQIAIPYPTSFHPESERELELWQEKIGSAKRAFMVSFVGGPRNVTVYPKMKVRDVLFRQCSESERCTTLKCNEVDCPKNPHLITNLFMESTFCLQPPGDSPTRKAVFDCLVAGTIPVFFSPDTAYTQYLWHLPEDGSSYSVLLEKEDIDMERVNVIDVLSQISEEKIRSMQEVIQRQILPSIVYDMPGHDPDKNHVDAFDLLLEHVLNPKFRINPSSGSSISEFEDPSVAVTGPPLVPVEP